MKTAELVGPALDWAVCVAEGNNPVINPVRFGGVSYGMFESELGYAIKRYSTSWEQGGPIIEREKIATDFDHDVWNASRYGDPFYASGPTPLIAAMRCYCCAKLGDEIDIPEELQPCQQPNL